MAGKAGLDVDCVVFRLGREECVRRCEERVGHPNVHRGNARGVVTQMWRNLVVPERKTNGGGGRGGRGRSGRSRGRGGGRGRGDNGRGRGGDNDGEKYRNLKYITSIQEANSVALEYLSDLF